MERASIRLGGGKLDWPEGMYGQELSEHRVAYCQVLARQLIVAAKGLNPWWKKKRAIHSPSSLLSSMASGVSLMQADNRNTMCPHVCCVYCPDPVWIPSVHACVDLSFVSSRQYKKCHSCSGQSLLLPPGMGCGSG